MKRSLELVLALTVGAAIGSTTGFTLAAFSSTTANPGNSFEAAASFCNGGTQTVTASADTYVDQSLLSSVSGTSTTLRVKSEVLANQRTLVRFELPAIPAYCSLSLATLRLNATSSTSGRTLQAFRLASGWSESDVTWSTQPATTGTGASTAAATGWIEFAVTSQVSAMYQGSNHGFLVGDSSEGALLAQTQVFSSREGTNPPRLVLTFA